MKRSYLVTLTLTVMFFMNASNVAAITKKDVVGCNDYGCTYDIAWDGWKGYLTLEPDGKGSLQTGGKTHRVRARILLNPQDTIEGMRGPGYVSPTTYQHRVVFWVDFKNTPSVKTDDQRFDGYMMTQTKDTIAGITLSKGRAFAFCATNKQGVLY